MQTPATQDDNSLELRIRTPATQDDNSLTRPVENPKIPCIYWAESVFKKSAPIIYFLKYIPIIISAREHEGCGKRWIQGIDDDDVMKLDPLLDTLNPVRIL